MNGSNIGITESKMSSMFCFNISLIVHSIVLYNALFLISISSIILIYSSQLILYFNNGIEINQYTHTVISEYLRKVHNLSKPKYTKIGNEFTKQKTIEVETYKYKRALRKKDNNSSILVPLISSLVVALQISKATVMDMQIYEFFESISRISAKEVADNLCRGLYAGTISMESLNKKELNWMRELR